MRGMCRLAAAVFAAAAIAAPGSAAAHESRSAGPLEFVVGWAEEPAFVGFKNAVSIRVARDGDPVEGLAATLKVDVSLDDQKTGPLELEPVFGEAGHYEAPLIPTAPGAYTFHFTGTAGTEKIDQTFKSSDGQFNEVQGTTEVAFPKKAPSNSELAEAVAGVNSTVERVDEDLGMTRTFAIIGLALGSLAFLLAIGSVARKR